MAYNDEVEINGNIVVIPAFFSGLTTWKLISDSSSTNNFIIPKQIQDSYNKIYTEAEKIKIPVHISRQKNDDLLRIWKTIDIRSSYHVVTVFEWLCVKPDFSLELKNKKGSSHLSPPQPSTFATSSWRIARCV